MVQLEYSNLVLSGIKTHSQLKSTIVNYIIRT
jgi:hypothetical protein